MSINTVKNSIKDRIKRIKSRLADLKKILSNDAMASFKEASQTTEMIQIYEKQLDSLKNRKKKQKTIKYTLKSSNKTLIYHLAKSNPDPFQNIISEKSPLGKKLKQAKVNDIFELNGEKFKIVKIQK